MRQVLVWVQCGNCSQVLKEYVLTEDKGIPISFIEKDTPACLKCGREHFYWLFLAGPKDIEETHGNIQ